MKIKELYHIKGFPVVIVTLALVSFVASVGVWLFPKWFDVLCMQTNARYLWQYLTGALIHNIDPVWVMWVHMGMNFMGLIPLGIIVEKVLSSRSILGLFLVEWIGSAILFQLVSVNNSTKACGISAIVYAFGTVGFYCIFVALKKGTTPCYKQPLFYYFLYELIGMLSMLNPMSGITIFMMHFSGIVTGVGMILIKRKAIIETIMQAK